MQDDISSSTSNNFSTPETPSSHTPRNDSASGDRPPSQEERPQRGGHRQRHRRFYRNNRRGNNRSSNNNPNRPSRPQASYNNDSRLEADYAPIGELDPNAEPVFAEGMLELSGKGYGFLREAKRSYNVSPNDIFVTYDVIKTYNLRDGIYIKGQIRQGHRGWQLFKLIEIEGEDPEKCVNLPLFEELTTISPTERISLETASDRYTTRIIDLMAPIGKGQRGLIVAPPRTGKTTLLQHIADAVIKNHPTMKLLILLVDERPEELTEMRRMFPQAELFGSSNDSDLKSHTRIAQLSIERAKRLVEQGKDVFVLMDSLTRIGRAFNNAMSGGGRTMSGGMDARAMEIPRKIFAAARNTEEAGSLTIIASALIETNSRMDDLIFQEFKGTGNMEIVLDRKISDQRIYPAIDIFLSGTRREELLLPAEDLHKINIIRRGLAGHKPLEAIDRILFFIRKYSTNVEVLKSIPG
jgi:transcription termination factor Rho